MAHHPAQAVQHFKAKISGHRRAQSASFITAVHIQKVHCNATNVANVLDVAFHHLQVYLLWGDDGQVQGSTKTANGLSYIPPAKPRLPGHAESYNPPGEYIPTEEEVAGYELLDPEDRPKFVPQAFKSLREVSARIYPLVFSAL